jgi:hypothetical protein
MGFLFNQVFWGALLIIIGVTVIIKVLFNIHIPLARIIFAFLLIYIGVWFLIGGQFGWRQHGNSIVFNDSQIIITKPSTEEYNVIFGKGAVDLTGITLDKGVTKVKLNIIFGSGVIKINPDIPTQIVVDSPFAAARMPDGNNITFGSGYAYNTKSFKDDQDYLLIKADVVFGGLEVIEYRP